MVRRPSISPQRGRHPGRAAVAVSEAHQRGPEDKVALVLRLQVVVLGALPAAFFYWVPAVFLVKTVDGAPVASGVHSA